LDCHNGSMAGRPKKPLSQAKSYTLRIRMTPAQRALLEEAAQSRGLETSTWARSELIALANELLQEMETSRTAPDKRKRS
jgi:uncharacterized protein (DUF1778 family)